MGAVVKPALWGFAFFLLIAVDLVLLGVIRLDNIGVTLLPLIGLATGAVLGGLAARPATAVSAPVAMAPATVPVAPVQPVPGPVVGGFVATHRAPAEGLAAWTSTAPGLPPDAHLDPWLPVQLVVREGDWARIRCANGWEAWVDARLLIAP